MKMNWTVCLFTALLPAAAQQIDNQERTLRCEENNWGDSRRERFCEIKEFPIPALSRISVDGRQNGGIAIKGWSRSDMLVRAKVETWAPGIADARSIAGQVHVQTGAGNIYADGPQQLREGNWGVSYEIFVPHRTSLSLKAHNGGISISDVAGDMDFTTLNGGLNLRRIGGTVKGSTTNGGVKAEFAGNRWEGAEFDVQTTNGGVSLTLPSNYSARLETRTVHGQMAIDFPITVTGKIGREISTNLGQGGPLVRAVTTNGSVAIRTAK